MSDTGDEQGRPLPRHQQALTEYLEELLREVPDEDWDFEENVSVVSPPATEAAPPPVRSAPPPAPPPEPAAAPVKEAVELPRPPLPEVAPPSKPPPVVVPELPPEPEPEITVAPAGPVRGEVEDGPPAWSRPYFQALLFHVGPLRLAVPLIKLQSVVPWTDEVSPTPRQPAWMHGLFFYRGKQVRVVNTAELVLPPDRRPPPDELEPRKLLVVGDGSWAFSCRDVSDVIRLEPEQVQWRSARGRRRWLAGTVREHLCALMDADAFAQLLDQEGGE